MLHVVTAKYSCYYYVLRCKFVVKLVTSVCVTFTALSNLLYHSDFVERNEYL